MRWMRKWIVIDVEVNVRSEEEEEEAEVSRRLLLHLHPLPVLDLPLDLPLVLPLDLPPVHHRPVPHLVPPQGLPLLHLHEKRNDKQPITPAFKMFSIIYLCFVSISFSTTD